VAERETSNELTMSMHGHHVGHVLLACLLALLIVSSLVAAGMGAGLGARSHHGEHPHHQD
jgi:hypothetical protein